MTNKQLQLLKLRLAIRRYKSLLNPTEQDWYQVCLIGQDINLTAKLDALAYRQSHPITGR